MKPWPLACALFLVAFPETTPQELWQFERGDSIVVGPFGLDGPSLAEIVRPLAQLANRRLLIKPEIERRLESNRFCVVGTIQVPKARVEELLESLLASCFFVFLPPTAEDLPWEIVDAKGADRDRIRRQVLAIEPNEIDAYATRHTLVSVPIALAHANALAVSASLRPFFPEFGLETVVSIEGSNALRLTGFGPTVVALARLVQQIDKEEPATRARSSSRRAEIEALKARVSALEKKLDAAPEKPK